MLLQQSTEHVSIVTRIL